ncbi:MAG TPA: endonuclease [Methanosarcinaceae archaeon]|nr:endonuclease [Methanosarcinaceae archaeon]
MKQNNLKHIYGILLGEFGHQDWWPAETPFEVVIGAVLTQQTRWTNVEQAIANLREHGLLEPETLAQADVNLVEELVHCCGFYRQKAARLNNIAKYFADIGMGTVFDVPTDKLRSEMLSLNGIGNETADSIVLYAANKPKFVIDAYTTRIMDCLGVNGNYMKLQELFEQELPTDVDLYKEYHALIVEFAKTYCGKKRCPECLLVPDATKVEAQENG